MGADFDGDTATLFDRVPWLPADAPRLQPAGIAWDEAFQRPMFLPKKQYLYGLFLLLSRPEYLSELVRDLEEQKVPALPRSASRGTAPTTSGSFDKFLARIIRSWSDPAYPSRGDRGRWWAALEAHALRALALDPGMGLLVTTDIKGIRQLEVVECGAAKRDLFRLSSRYPSEVEEALAGRSLDIYLRVDVRRDRLREDDPIGRVMLASRISAGQFGSAQKQLLSQAIRLDTSLVRDIQYITELAMQRALSPKGGPRPLNVKVFEEVLRKLMMGESYSDEMAADENPGTRKTFYEDPGFRVAWARITEVMPAKDQPLPLWRWLKSPHRLRDLIRRAEGQEIRIPIDDLRVSPFVKDWSGLAGGGIDH
jgi:hypothetical protein